MDIQELSEKVRQQSAFCMNLLREVEGTVIGQKALVESILTGFLAEKFEKKRLFRDTTRI